MPPASRRPRLELLTARNPLGPAREATAREAQAARLFKVAARLRGGRPHVPHSSVPIRRGGAAASRRRRATSARAPAPFLPMSRAEMDVLGWDACDVVLVTGDVLRAGLDTPVTFRFRHAGQVTLPVPQADPTAAS